MTGAGGGGRVVPVFAVTGGRTRAGDHDLPIESVVTATDAAADALQPEYRAIVAMARRPEGGGACRSGSPASW